MQKATCSLALKDSKVPDHFDLQPKGRESKRNSTMKVGLVALDEIHLLGVDRGRILEVIVSRMGYISSQTERVVGFVGLSTASANASNFVDWLGVGEIGLFNVKPIVRLMPLEKEKIIKEMGLVNLQSFAKCMKDIHVLSLKLLIINFFVDMEAFLHLTSGCFYGQGYPGNYYCPRMNGMNTPVYTAICTHSPIKVFVASDEHLWQFLSVIEEVLQMVLS
ncbi:hypothetical protein SADUNF_Sadunf15G0045600 [Salix dunnii]|uniref:Uncharacterized protein n=1 Tax=Salix dunnii TaxID=1413687 RepID=A0A835JCJ5_9ROSI|nr:hypothetical protein SADUNF_Sadunf15G0045600 [Salix dunnii]